MNGNLKLTFMVHALTQYYREGIEAMRLVMRRMKIEETGEGYDSFSFQVLQQGAGATSSLSFRQYLRFVDMGVGRAHPLGGLTSMRTTLQSSNRTGQQQVRSRGRKAKKLYSRVMYGKLNWLYNKLLYGYTEETIAQLKANLQP